VSRDRRGACRLGSSLFVGLVVVIASSWSTVPALAAPTPNAEAGSIGLRLLDQPANSTENPRAQIYIVDHLAPGTEIERRIEVSTTSTGTQVHLYAAAANIVNGSFLGEPGETPNDLSTWISVTPGDIKMMPDQVTTATVTIIVPSDAAPGEHYGVVWAEARSAASEQGVTQVNRVGIRVYLSIGSGGPPAADFEITSLSAGRSAEGVRTVVARVANTGGRALDISGELDLRSTSGDLQAGPYPADLGSTLGIGVTEPVTIAINTELPTGPWDAEITLRSGLVERSARGELTFPAAGTLPAVPVTPLGPGENGLALRSLAFAAFILLAVFVAVNVIIRRRSMRRTEQTFHA
jgi:hypothetical protein